jgi:carboxypeptidase C (cathepsin A)
MLCSEMLALYLNALSAAVLRSSVVAVRVLPDAHRSAAKDVLLSMQHEKYEENSIQRLSFVNVPFSSSPDDHEVKSLPLLSEGTLMTKHWAGLLPASGNGDKYLFYWLFAPDLSNHEDLQEADIPLVIWLNGGLGCSLMDRLLFLKNGPFRFEPSKGSGNCQLVAAQHSWHKTPAYMLYIDQPVGTGLSFTTAHNYPKNDQEVDADFYSFLNSFFAVHADKFVTKQKVNRPFYFLGESHAGKVLLVICCSWCWLFLLFVLPIHWHHL